MHRKTFVGLLLVGAIISGAACYPLMNVLQGNPAGWFTMDNIDDYGDDLDERAKENGGQLVVFTGHPSYVIGADNARLLFDMPRNHYYASTFNNTTLGNEFYSNLTNAFQTGQADVAISGPMTEAMLEQNATAAAAFHENYCRVQDPKAQALYNATDSTLYVHQRDCPAYRRPKAGRVLNAV